MFWMQDVVGGWRWSEKWSEGEEERRKKKESCRIGGRIDEGVKRKYWDLIEGGSWKLGLWLVVVVCGEWLATFSHKWGSKMALHKRGRVAKFLPIMLGFLVCNSIDSIPTV